MPTKESLQHKLDRVRPPRVQITYDVEIGGAIELKELPFVASPVYRRGAATRHSTKRDPCPKSSFRGRKAASKAVSIRACVPARLSR